ncbi:MAG: hypothetical protein AAF628_16910 [Planctomycetota bacterium]
MSETRAWYLDPNLSLALCLVVALAQLTITVTCSWAIGVLPRVHSAASVAQLERELSDARAASGSATAGVAQLERALETERVGFDSERSVWRVMTALRNVSACVTAVALVAVALLWVQRRAAALTGPG